MLVVSDVMLYVFAAAKSMESAVEDVMMENQVDVVFSGHVHAYERSCRVYQYACTDGAPYYITIGDGGNKEGLADEWIEPQPDWSVYRMASYGFGELRVINSTHTYWSWHQNSDLVPAVSDEFYIVKDSAAVEATATHTTGRPAFVGGERGERAKAFNSRARAAAKSGHSRDE
jgi:predicted phosphohydrolase